MVDVLEVLQALKEEPRSTQALLNAFPQWSDRTFAAQFLGNMNRTGLIKKRANGYWALTSKGKERLEASGSPVSQPPADEPAGAQSDAEGANRESSVDLENIPTVKDIGAIKKPDIKPAPASAFDMARRLQHEIPNGSSLVIESDELFLVWRGARFSIEQRKDLEAFKAIQEAYLGEVA